MATLHARRCRARPRSTRGSGPAGSRCSGASAGAGCSASSTSGSCWPWRPGFVARPALPAARRRRRRGSRGRAHAPPTTVRRAGRASPQGDQLMDVDLQAAGERVAELPWVRRGPAAPGHRRHGRRRRHRAHPGRRGRRGRRGRARGRRGPGRRLATDGARGRGGGGPVRRPRRRRSPPASYLPRRGRRGAGAGRAAGRDAGARHGARARATRSLGRLDSGHRRSASATPTSSTPRCGRCAPCSTRSTSPARP